MWTVQRWHYLPFIPRTDVVLLPGWCGNTEAHCSITCLSAFGTCAISLSGTPTRTSTPGGFKLHLPRLSITHVHAFDLCYSSNFSWLTGARSRLTRKVFVHSCFFLYWQAVSQSCYQACKATTLSNVGSVCSPTGYAQNIQASKSQAQNGDAFCVDIAAGRASKCICIDGMCSPPGPPANACDQACKVLNQQSPTLKYGSYCSAIATCRGDLHVSTVRASGGDSFCVGRSGGRTSVTSYCCCATDNACS